VPDTCRAPHRRRPDYYVLLCARRYAETLRKLRAATNEAEFQRHRRTLHYLMESGLLEWERERRIRLWRLPAEIRDRVENLRLPPLDRPISREEAELIRQTCAIPPAAHLDCLTGDEMMRLADMYEGWAQDRRLAPLDTARLLGWADGMRTLASEVGADYEPPASVPGEPVPLTKFLANSMSQAPRVNHEASESVSHTRGIVHEDSGGTARGRRRVG
jgi:hypothetical protein